MKTVKLVTILFGLMLTAQAAFAFYDSSAQRWLTRDPIGEPGFQALQTATRPDQMPFVQPWSSRWIDRDLLADFSYNLPTYDRFSFDAQSEGNLYRFVENDAANFYDPDGRFPNVITFPIHFAKCLKSANDWYNTCKKTLPKPEDYDCGHQAEYFDDFNTARAKCVANMKKVFQNCMKAAY